uniref:Uncharacterized protein n=1 Tax=Helianthus annuus TaxID=4232 RepID=A0A251SBE3_HELAN
MRFRTTVTRNSRKFGTRKTRKLLKPRIRSSEQYLEYKGIRNKQGNKGNSADNKCSWTKRSESQSLKRILKIEAKIRTIVVKFGFFFFFFAKLGQKVKLRTKGQNSD